VRRRLAENDLKPWRKDMWRIPQVDGEYVARMEDVLDLYAQNRVQPQNEIRRKRMTTRQRQSKGSRQTARAVATARKTLDGTAGMRGQDPLTALKIEALRDEIAHYCDLGTRAIDQARCRVLHGEQVPTSEKIYSIFEPHTDPSSAARCARRSSLATKFSPAKAPKA
jgi:transposase, IS5 family